MKKLAKLTPVHERPHMVNYTETADGEIRIRVICPTCGNGGATFSIDTQPRCCCEDNSLMHPASNDNIECCWKEFVNFIKRKNDVAKITSRKNDNYLPEVGDVVNIKDHLTGKATDGTTITYIDETLCVGVTGSKSEAFIIERCTFTKHDSIDELVSHLIKYYGNPKGAELYLGLARYLHKLGYHNGPKVEPISEQEFLSIIESGITYKYDFKGFVERGYIVEQTND